MRRATRDRFASSTRADVQTGNACWETPPAVFIALDEEFGFDVDLCGDPRRHHVSPWLGPGSPHHPDALSAPWREFGRVGFANPPYGPFAARMLPLAQAWARQGFTSVLLLPLRVTAAFRAHVLRGAAEVRFCDKRIVFWEHGRPRLNPRTGRPDAALFDSIVVVYRPGRYRRPQVGEWLVPPHVEGAA